MPSKLNISSTLSLPLEFVTQTQAILARKRVGKSYTASVQAEELLKASQQVVVIDITGAWWGLRSSADGKGPGYSILIAGGDHGDIPLEPMAGEVMADAVVSERFSCILDLSLMRKGQMTRFLIDFLETLYRQNRVAMHLFCDEADAYAPQKPFGDEARVLGAMNDIVRRGGIRGIGCTLITQRPSILNKDVLTQCGILTCLRMSHPKDLAPIREWVDVHGDIEQSKEMMKSLPSLPIGTAWVWSPAWPNDKDLFDRVEIRRRETFDSGATPKAGEAKKAPKVVAEVNIKALGTKITETAEKLKENDPKLLKGRVADLDRQLAAALNKQPDQRAIQSAVDRAVNQATQPFLDQITGIHQKLKTAFNQLRDSSRVVEEVLEELRPGVIPGTQYKPPTVQVIDEIGRPGTMIQRPPAPKAAAKESPQFTRQSKGPGVKLPTGEKTILIAVAGYAEVERSTLTVLTGYKRSSRDSYIQRLREKGFVLTSGANVRATGPGIEALGNDYQPLPRGAALRRHWLDKLPEGERRILEILVREGKPAEWSRVDLDDVTGYKRSSRDTYLQRLSARKLVEFPSLGMVRASTDLF